MDNVKFSFEDLIVYQKSLDFVDIVYDICEKFPKREQYVLSSQYIRAANSIALNIAEGAGASDAQFNRYLQIALNSSRECVVCTTIAHRRNYISEEKNKKIRIQLAELSKMITSLQKRIKNRLKLKT
ncbi:four helix bundle protein [Aquimarina sp. U1-2]|uniref:four helix bundle protein n=1 Tax=Aquimarina sp. U1-2 TaxID=2823141 RepID=UPI001AECC2BE|nr:four helix bundle protein [Aquimarina sp. U1-2]MBP2830641.1 four helix bundle protein [Aquimarina sp. U1-2]